MSKQTFMILHEHELDLYKPFNKVSKGAKIKKNRYNQVPHLTQDTNGKVKNSQLDTTNESQEVKCRIDNLFIPVKLVEADSNYIIYMVITDYSILNY